MPLFKIHFELFYLVQLREKHIKLTHHFRSLKVFWRHSQMQTKMEGLLSTNKVRKCAIKFIIITKRIFSSLL